ncbi:unnamed protein product, partial [Ectocarpus sp. 12 AP-2014]
SSSARRYPSSRRRRPGPRSFNTLKRGERTRRRQEWLGQAKEAGVNS